MIVGDYLKISLPYFNLVLVSVVVFFLIRVLLSKDKKTYITPWKFLLFAILAYTIEEILAIIDIAGITIIPKVVFPIIETIIICLFIYMVLLQKKYTDMQL